MYLQSLVIKSFGQLQDFQLNFPEVANTQHTLLIWPNEAGKSTVIACLRALFYGLGNKRTKGLVRRQQYLNFTGVTSRARLNFSHMGRNYELERSFGKTERTDHIQLLNLASGEQVDLAGVEPGYYLFGLNEEQFINSLLIEQMNLTLPATSSAPSVVEALTNLGLTGNSAVNVQLAIEKVELQLKDLRFKRGQGGKIFACNEKINALQTAINSLEQDCQNFNYWQETANQLTKELKQSEALLTEKNKQKASLVAAQQKLSELERAQAELLEKQYQAKEANETEYKQQMAKSFELEAKQARLENSLQANKQALDLLNLQNKKLSQRQLANKAKQSNWQNNMAKQSEEIRVEQAKLQAGEAEIKACSDALSENVSKTVKLQEQIKDLQSQKEKLTLNSLQAQSQIKQSQNLSYLVLLSFSMLLSSLFGYINGHFSSPLLGLSVALSAFLTVVYLLKRRKLPNLEANKSELEQVALNLTHCERDLQDCQQTEIDLKSKKIELMSQNKRTYLDSLCAQRENARRDLAELANEIEQTELEIAEQNKQKQAKQLLISHEAAELAQAKQKVLEQNKLVQENEKFLASTQDLLQAKNQNLQNETQTQITNICQDYNWPELDLEQLTRQVNSTLSKLNSRIEEIHASLHEQHAQVSAAMLQAQAKEIAPITLTNKKQELELWQAKLQTYEKREQELKLANKLLSELFIELQNDFSPKLRERCSFYLNSLSLGRYTDLTVDKTLHLQLRYKEDQSWHVAEYLSGAAYEQVYLALRLALADLIASEQELPLLIDDCLVQFDREHQVAALEVLSNFAIQHNCQLLFFSCHSYLSEIIKESNWQNWQVLHK